MRILVTGSSGHLGEALVRALRDERHDDRSRRPRLAVDRRRRVGQAARRVHAPAELVETNITRTLNLLEEGSAAGVSRLVFTSTTSTFGRALAPAEGRLAAWITEDVTPVPRNIYGVTKTAAEDLCELAGGPLSGTIATMSAPTTTI